jgi:hypothetical protein
MAWRTLDIDWLLRLCQADLPRSHEPQPTRESERPFPPVIRQCPDPAGAKEPCDTEGLTPAGRQRPTARGDHECACSRTSAKRVRGT